MTQYTERKSMVEELHERFGWPTKIKRDGYVAFLYGKQDLNDGETPLPVYRFPGGVKVVDSYGLVPAE